MVSSVHSSKSAHLGVVSGTSDTHAIELIHDYLFSQRKIIKQQNMNPVSLVFLELRWGHLGAPLARHC